MNFGIVGSRRYPSRSDVARLVNELPNGSVVVSGNCRGPDRWAEDAARARGLAIISHPAKWNEPCGHGDVHRRVASHGTYWLCQGFERNGLIVQDSDRLHAFVVDRVGGTWDTIHKAKKAKKPVRLHWPDGGEEEA